MRYMKKPEIVEAYILGGDKEAAAYVRLDDIKRYNHVKALNGLIIKVRKGDYIIPETTSTLSDPRARALSPKVFSQHYKEIGAVDSIIIEKWGEE